MLVGLLGDEELSFGIKPENAIKVFIGYFLHRLEELGARIGNNLVTRHQSIRDHNSKINSPRAHTMSILPKCLAASSNI
jgi:hypothetical protein